VRRFVQKRNVLLLIVIIILVVIGIAGC